MSQKKKVVAVVITAVAITGSASALANASNAKPKRVSSLLEAHQACRDNRRQIYSPQFQPTQNQI